MMNIYFSMSVHEWKTGGWWSIWKIMIVVFLLHFVPSSESHRRCDPGDSSSLLEFKAGLIHHGRPFKSWNASTNCCHWRGVSCSSAGRVRNLAVEGSDVFPPMKNPRYGDVVGETLGNLTALRTLHLTNLIFNGSVPTTWGHLVKLTTLSLTCDFNGGIPREFGQLTELGLWHMKPIVSVAWDDHIMNDFADLTGQGGQLPNEVCNLTKLEDVDLSYMALTGELSSCLDKWRRIRSLAIPFNFFRGPIPSSVGNLSFLESLDLSSNLFTGPIPSSLAKLRALNSLTLSANQLTGQIPADIGENKYLSVLALDENDLTGEIPRSFGQLPVLSKLYLDDNYLVGNIPSELGNLTNCGVMLLDNNFLSGPIPPELGNISLLVLGISHLNLSGPIPDTLGNLDIIAADFNSLTGRFPSSFAKVFEVTLSNNKLSSFEQSGLSPAPEEIYIGSLDLSSNFLQGPIPEWLCNLWTLNLLDMSQNNLEGPIPVSLFTLPNLFSLNLSHNNLTLKLPSPSPSGPVSPLNQLSLHQNFIYGSITESFLAFFNSLAILDIGNNRLSGTIPRNMGDIMPLGVLDLSKNNLSGRIPTSLSEVSVVDLSHNKFSGSIPFTMPSQYEGSSSIDVSYNNLTGTFPQSLNLTVLHRLQLGNNDLSGEIPDIFGSCDVLVSLSLHHNKFQGNLPASLQKCSQLAVLDVRSNELNGSLPLWLNNFAPTLRVFVIGSNNFHGVLPAWLSDFTKLQVLDFSNNQFSGRIPPNLNQIEALQQRNQTLSGGSDGTLYDSDVQIIAKGGLLNFVYVLVTTTSLDLSGNGIDGDVPPELGDLQGLIFLNLSSNNLSGVIPTTLAKLTALESLDLSTNQLSGTIPSQMAVDLISLEYLNVSHNFLSGEIPYRNQFRTFNSSSFARNPGLCGPPLLVPCLSLPPPSPATADSHESPGENMWVSFPAFGVGVAMSFSLVSSFLFPHAYAKGKEARINRTVPTRRQPYGVFTPRQ